MWNSTFITFYAHKSPINIYIRINYTFNNNYALVVDSLSITYVNSKSPNQNSNTIPACSVKRKIGKYDNHGDDDYFCSLPEWKSLKRLKTPPSGEHSFLAGGKLVVIVGIKYDLFSCSLPFLPIIYVHPYYSTFFFIFSLVSI